MTSATTGAAEPIELATVQLELAGNVSAFQLRALINALDSLYFASLWLDRAEERQFDGFFPERYAPSVDETLWIEQLEIGTPNTIGLRGRLKQIEGVIAILAATMGVPYTAAKAYKVYQEAEAVQTSAAAEAQRSRAEAEGAAARRTKENAEARKTQAEAVKTEADADLARLLVIEKARELHEKGKISEKSRDHKETIVRDALRDIRDAASLVRTQEIKSFHVDVRDGRAAYVATEILSRTAFPKAAPALAKAIRARETFLGTRSPADQKHLQAAFEQLCNALEPLEAAMVEQVLEQASAAYGSVGGEGQEVADNQD